MYKIAKLLIYVTGITGMRKKKTYYQSAKFIIKMNQLPAVSLQTTISEETALSISSYTDSPKLISKAG